MSKTFKLLNQERRNILRKHKQLSKKGVYLGMWVKAYYGAPSQNKSNPPLVGFISTIGVSSTRPNYEDYMVTTTVRCDKDKLVVGPNGWFHDGCIQPLTKQQVKDHYKDI